MTKVWVALGSNLGDSQQILQQAWQALAKYSVIQVCSLSHPYRSAPVGMKSENQFLNAVGVLETDCPPESLLQLLQDTEREFGRHTKSRENGYQDRLLDLDILYYGNQILSTALLQIPHPHIAERLFVLAPLAELDPEHLHPLAHLSTKSMYSALQQKMNAGEEELQVIERLEWQ